MIVKVFIVVSMNLNSYLHLYCLCMWWCFYRWIHLCHPTLKTAGPPAKTDSLPQNPLLQPYTLSLIPFVHSVLSFFHVAPHFLSMFFIVSLEIYFSALPLTLLIFSYFFLASLIFACAFCWWFLIHRVIQFASLSILSPSEHSWLKISGY